MPYSSIDKLPDAVKQNLPAGAQTLWMTAFNQTYKSHPDWKEGDRAQYAWGAVKRVYEKKDGKWIKKSNSSLSLSLATEEESDECVLDYINDHFQELELGTGDIVAIIPRRFWSMDVKRGLPLPKNHAKRLWEGSATVAVTGDPIDHKLEPLHIIEGSVCYGIARLGAQMEVGVNDFHSIFLKHLILDDDAKRTWPGKEKLFYYSVDWLKKYPGPLPITKRYKSIEGLVERSSYSFRKLESFSAVDILYMHSYCHSVESESIKQFHNLVSEEMELRGIKHPVYSWIDRNEPQPLVNQVIKDKVSMEDFIESLPEQFTIDEPPPKIWLIGKLASEGVSDSIDILVQQDYPDPRIAHRLVDEIKDEGIKSRINIKFSSKGPISDAIPLYRDSYQRLTAEVNKEVYPGKSIKPLKPKQGVGRYEFYTLQDMWDKWASSRIDNGLIIQKKYDGMYYTLHHIPETLSEIVSEDKISSEFPSSIEELKSIGITTIVTAELVWYDTIGKIVSNIEELGVAQPKNNTLKLLTASKTVDDSNIVFHVNDLLYVDGKSIANLPYIERLKKLDEIIPKDFVHLKIVPYSVVSNRPSFEKAVSTLRSLPGADGVVVKEIGSIYNFSGRTGDYSKLFNSGDINQERLSLDDCQYAEKENICPLYNRQQLSKVEYPIRCQIANNYKCPLIEPSAYEPLSKVDIIHWELDSEQDDKDSDTRLHQSI